INAETLSASANGTMDETRVWSVVRSPIDIQRSMSSALTGNEAGLAGYWRFGEGSGATVADLSPNHNDGVLGGANGLPTWVPNDGAPLASVGTETARTAIDSFTVSFSEDLLVSAAANAANYSL